MKKKNGFTLIELLASLLVLSVVLIIGIVVTRNTLATSLTQLRYVSDNEVFTAARDYVQERDIKYNENGNVCVSVNELINYGYLEDTNDVDLKKKIVKVTRDNLTKAIEIIRYVDKCN